MSYKLMIRQPNLETTETVEDIKKLRIICLTVIQIYDKLSL
ncbi:MAG: hypothetical protein ACERKV_00960 [Clostridiaceae bacterium]